MTKDGLLLAPSTQAMTQNSKTPLIKDILPSTILHQTLYRQIILNLVHV